MTETRRTLFGIEGRATLILWEHGRTFMHQTFQATRHFKDERGTPCSLAVEMRFDDNPQNGHNTFAITANRRENGRWDAGGCLHEDIAQHFPEFAHLIRWHLVSTEGPMHYLANTLYHASDRDHFGKAKGEATAFEHYAYFGNSPVGHKVEPKFLKFLQSRMSECGAGEWFTRSGQPFTTCAIGHKEPKTFGPKYSLVGFAEEWYACPFDTELEATEFAEGLNTTRVRFIAQPVRFSDGKARELDHARSCAVWPEATDAELSVDSGVLRTALEARLPALLAAFRADMEACGFQWSTAQA